MSRLDARSAFLSALIDDAALFPPAREPMDVAVRGHTENRAGPYGWMQGRFLCPASRLEELAAALPGDAPSWPVGVICDGPAVSDDWVAALRADLRTSATVTERTAGRAWGEAFEVRLPDPDPDAVRERYRNAVAAVEDAGFDRPVTGYLEVPLGGTTADALAALGSARATARPASLAAPLAAKVRCGGITVEAFPSVEQVASFVNACVKHRVEFKATAGLHHPYPRHDPETGARMHGFLGVLGGAALRAAGVVTAEQLPSVIAEEDPSVLALDADGLRWRDSLVEAKRLAEIRGTIVHGYGSCSFREPVEDLTELGVLPLPTEARP